MILLGITGPIGHGKSSFADALAYHEPGAKHFESSAIISEVANMLRQQANTTPRAGNLASINNWLKPLPSILKTYVSYSCDFKDIEVRTNDISAHPDMYHKLFEYIQAASTDPLLLQEEITPTNKAKHRALLQWFGAYLPSRTLPELWYRELIRRATSDTSCQLAIFGGVRFPADAQVIHEAGGIVAKIIRPGFGQVDQEDPTERERASISFETTVQNDATLQALQNCALSFLEDLRQSTLKTHYKASSFTHPA